MSRLLKQFFSIVRQLYIIFQQPTRVINPGFPEPGKPGRFSNQKTRIWVVLKPGFSGLAFFTYISCKWRIFTAEMDKNSRTALCSNYFIYVTFPVWKRRPGLQTLQPSWANISTFFIVLLSSVICLPSQRWYGKHLQRMLQQCKYHMTASGLQLSSFPATKEEVNVFACVCLSVSLSVC